MPASERTWRDQKLMHVVFGVSALIMLVSTVWMLERDHNREWRRTQLQDRGKERWAFDARLAEQSARSHDILARLEGDLRVAQSAAIDAALVEQFKDLVEAEEERLALADELDSTADLDALDEALADLAPKAAAARQRRAEIEPKQQAARDALATKVSAEEGAENGSGFGAAEGDTDADQLKALQAQAKAALYELQQADRDRGDAEQEAMAARSRLLRKMDGIISEAQRREDALTVQKKFVAADHTAIVSAHGLAIGEGKPEEEIDALQAQIDELSAQINELDSAVAAAKDYRVALEAIRREISADEKQLAKDLIAARTDLARLAENRSKNTWNFGEWLTRRPILNALYDGNVRIDQIWLPDITINYNFSSVARYDRCVTCHRSIDTTAPGSATVPAYSAIEEKERDRIVRLGTPPAAPQIEVSPSGEELEPSLESVYGFTLASEGQIDPFAVTIKYVVPETLAAEAGLEMGDIIKELNGARIDSNLQVQQTLLRTAAWGEPVDLLIHRGLDQPFTSHPRLDLYVGSMSPHKKGEMGCTICHDGQGSATDFKWASHTPNDPDTALEWSREYGWFNNHHWIFPMTPERFIESNCLKCHHDVFELEPSERFPEPPAPKLVKGYELVRRFGCYGCHEINGYDGPDKRIGPDLRVEPNYHEVAAAVLNDPILGDLSEDTQLTDAQLEWIESIRESATTLSLTSTADVARDQLYRAIQKDVEHVDNGEEPQLEETTRALAVLLKDVEAPGTLRRAGPSLRHLHRKVDYEWVYSWIRRPADFRPTTRMPQFFGLHEHLEEHIEEFPVGEDGETLLTDKEYTERFEKIEIRALTEYLLQISAEQQFPFEYLDPPTFVTEAASSERGKWLFESRGCLACHSHESFPGIAADQGPDLSRLAAKLDSEKGRQWLYSWLKQPYLYHARTVMPNLYLEPIEETDATGQATGVITDPAADIVEFLLSVPTDWQPENVPPEGEWTAEEEAALEDLAAVWLSAFYPRRRAERYAREGIPATQGDNIKSDERVLVGMDPHDRQERIARQLEYVARRSLSRYGCFGCHDIPGYEAAKPIGTALAEWGRKEPEKLAFENITTFLAAHGIDGQADHAEHDDHEAGAHHGLDPLEFDDDTGYFLQALNSHQRQGFLWQKLRMPRSYDYEKTRNKRYDERLRMPKFPINAQEREAIMTFVLGLVNEPPNEKYVYHADARTEAVVKGRGVLEKYNCAGCHVLDMERWRFAIEPDWFLEPPEPIDFPFLQPTVTTEQIEASLATDHRGMIRAELYGMPVYDEQTGEPRIVDEDGVPLEPEDDDLDPFYEFTLYRDRVVAGAPRLVGLQNLLVPAKREGYGPANGEAVPPRGGDLARYLYPRAIAEEKKTNPAAMGAEAWGWLPPPLIGQGSKVQTDWMHDFLMNPYRIRPAVIMRMPDFHMSSEEASQLVNYFAARDNVQWPYEYIEERRGDYLAAKEQRHPALLEDALKVVTDGNYCVKCHAVGDYQPKGAIKTQGPQLADVYRRLRPSYVRRWIANPKRILPYTGMPVNIPYAPGPPHFGGVSQELFPGTSIEQLDGIVDLMLNFDEYSKRQTTISSMVTETPADGQEQAAATAAPSSDPAAGG